MMQNSSANSCGRPDRHRKATWAIAVLLAIPVLLLGWSLVEARWLTTEYSVVSNPDVPGSFNGFRIAYVADIHAGTLLGEGHLRRTIERVNELEPDLILLGGDYVGGGERGNEMLYRNVGDFEATYGTIAVLGNHDIRWDPEEMRRELGALDIIVLEDDNVRVADGQDSIRIAGVKDYNTQEPSIEEAARDLSEREFAVLVSHNPDLLVTALPQVEGAFDLALAGHTHGGQITLFGAYAPFMPSRYGQRFRGGWQEIAGVPVMVTRGSGTFVIPMRFFAPPQVHLIELRRGPRSVHE